MPIQRRRTDGFSEDGLSYSVASDFDKQIGQALAAQEARLKDPRYIPGAQVERPDAPDILNQELIDPVLTAFGMPNSEDRAARHGRYDRYSNRNPDANRYTSVKGPNGEAFVLDKTTGKTQPFDVPPGHVAPTVIPKTGSQVSNWFQNSPTMQAEESEAVSKLNQPGADAVDILGLQHPTLIKNPPYATRYGPIYRSAMEKRQRAANVPTVSAEPNIGSLIAERDKLMGSLTPDLPPDTASAITNRIGQIDQAVRQPGQGEDAEELITVINPKGKTVKIRKADFGRVPGYRLP